MFPIPLFLCSRLKKMLTIRRRVGCELLKPIIGVPWDALSIEFPFIGLRLMFVLLADVIIFS